MDVLYRGGSIVQLKLKLVFEIPTVTLCIWTPLVGHNDSPDAVGISAGLPPKIKCHF
jgi:hypothetical protein